MFLKKFQLFNYKSYLDSGRLEFTPGINIIVGRNNSGKTALLQALSLNFTDEIHKSIKTLPHPSTPLQGFSRVEISFSLEKDEFIFFLDRLPLPLAILEAGTQNSQYTVELFRAWLYDYTTNAEVNLSVLSSSRVDVEHTLITDLAFNLYLPHQEEQKGQYNVIIIKRNINDSIQAYSSSILGLGQTITVQILPLLVNRIYRFHAERLNVGICRFWYSSELQPNASNLAEVLCILQSSNPHRYERFNQYVSIVLPEIQRISIKPMQADQLEIRVWFIDPITEREDLAIALSQCGTGVGQVLAILYILITSQEPRIIIIDEPQSFLHPGAAKKLIEILREFPQHQYFISTHSPEIISSANPSKIVKLQYEDCETKASLIDSRETAEQRSLLAEIGVRLSDVFGADNILWVEGPTEERCFPLILNNLAKKPLRGTQILAIKNTGDLEGKRAHVIFDIYDRISGGKSLFPPAIGFVLDREARSEDNITDLQKRSPNKVKFLSRRMYENYLLDSEAIAAVINEENKASITSGEIQAWLDKKKQEGFCLPKNVQRDKISPSGWLEEIDGANLLKNLFIEFSQKRVEFSKTRHSYMLTEWLVEHKPDYLSELAEFLKTLLNDR